MGALISARERFSDLHIVEQPTEVKKYGGYKTTDPLRSVEDIRKICDYFEQHEDDLPLLLFIVQVNIARRIGDVLALCWKDFYFEDGRKKAHLVIDREEKTGKYTRIKLNDVIWQAIDGYVGKYQIDVSSDYNQKVFVQLKGTHKGKLITQAGFRKALKRAATACGIDGNIATHSLRKTFGYWAKKMHPTDGNALQTIMQIYRHSSEAITVIYTGEGQDKIDQYYDDISQLFSGDAVENQIKSSPVVALESSKLRSILLTAYKMGKDNAEVEDENYHTKNVMTLIDMVEKDML